MQHPINIISSKARHYHLQRNNFFRVVIIQTQLLIVRCFITANKFVLADLFCRRSNSTTEVTSDFCAYSEKIVPVLYICGVPGSISTSQGEDFIWKLSDDWRLFYQVIFTGRGAEDLRTQRHDGKFCDSTIVWIRNRKWILAVSALTFLYLLRLAVAVVPREPLQFLPPSLLIVQTLAIVPLLLARRIR